MASQRIFRGVVPTEYTTSNGEKKTKWNEVGVVFKNDNDKLFMIVDPMVNFAALPHEPGRGVVVRFFQYNEKGGNGYRGGTANVNTGPFGSTGDANTGNIPF